MKKICVVTGTRAEYGLLSNIMLEIKKSEKLILQTIVTGAHLSEDFGLTYKEIEKDGFRIDEKINILTKNNIPVNTATSLGLAVIGFSTAFEKLQPDLILVLGDRYEILAAAETALVMQIPVAHISGGEITEGAIDDSIRHAITKLSAIHFPANEEYRHRIIQLGENPKYVFNVGDPGVENIHKLNYLTKEELEEFFGYKLENTFLTTFHPVTTEKSSIQQLENLFAALDRFPKHLVIFTKANADNEGREINELIDAYAEKNKERVFVYDSLGKIRYLSTLKYSVAVVGNSSSGIVEAPVLGIPTVNIGNRQKGRVQANTIINCDATEESIYRALQQAVLYKQDSSREIDLKYNGMNTSTDIIHVLENLEFKDLVIKKFFDQ